jgi:hypothetical protein
MNIWPRALRRPRGTSRILALTVRHRSAEAESRHAPDEDIVPREPPRRRRVSLSMLLPVGSDFGAYEIHVLDANLQSRASSSGDAILHDFVTRLSADLDFQSLPAGAYQLAMRRMGEDWQLFPGRVD